MAFRYKVVVIDPLNFVAGFKREEDAQFFAKHLFADNGIECCVHDDVLDVRTDYCTAETKARITRYD